MARNIGQPITGLKKYGETIVNHYSSLNFDAQFASRISDLYENFNYKIRNRQLQGIDVTGNGKWIKVWVNRNRYRNLNARSRQQLQNILNKHLYPAKTYRWGYFKGYIALGPHTVGANKQWGGNNAYRVFRVH
ncbi:hypothetical protein LCGC14_1825330 [marine sediment metagenome]|uniref:Uncharacterized protein n=1 Tax=marine sediment metagenome TaxID=412755 RepID=A0A0F9IXC4_9ZZZZ